MADRQKGMGRGLAAILSVAPKDDAEELRQLPVELIAPNPNQPRATFDEVGSSRVDLQACKLEYSIVSPK